MRLAGRLSPSGCVGRPLDPSFRTARSCDQGTMRACAVVPGNTSNGYPGRIAPGHDVRPTPTSVKPTNSGHQFTDRISSGLSHRASRGMGTVHPLISAGDAQLAASKAVSHPVVLAWHAAWLALTWPNRLVRCYRFCCARAMGEWSPPINQQEEIGMEATVEAPSAQTRKDYTSRAL